MRRWVVALVAVLVGVLVGVVPVTAQEAPPPEDPQRAVLGVVSPLASPVCGAAGASTLLVPIVAGMVQDQIDTGVSMTDLLLDSLGPVFVACAELPPPGGTRCALIDDQIVGVWPEDLSGAGFTPIAVGGNVVDSVERGLAVLGLGPADALQEPLECSVPASSGVAEAPPAPPSVDSAALDELPLATGFDLPVAAPPLPSITSTAGATVEVPAEPSVQLGTQTLLEIAWRRASSPVVALQLLVAGALAAFLAFSWATSWRLHRRP